MQIHGQYIDQMDRSFRLFFTCVVISFFVFFPPCCSGEKTTTVEWPNSLEIKGRVRLDAFEKFIKELPMSRSRAVMVLKAPFFSLAFLFFCFILHQAPAYQDQRILLTMANNLDLVHTSMEVMDLSPFWKELDEFFYFNGSVLKIHPINQRSNFPIKISKSNFEEINF